MGTMEQKFKRYLEIKNEIQKLNDEKLKIEIDFYNHHKDVLDAVEEGQKSFKDDGYKLTIIKKMTVSVDDAMADVVGFGFKKKFSLDKKEYKNLNEEQRKMVDECITTKPAKPSFSLELL